MVQRTPGPGKAGPNEAGQYLGVGLQFAGSILIFLFGGRWLDERLGTSPWLLLLGVFVGAAAGFYAIYFSLVIAPRNRERERRDTRGEAP